jgi:hypothetical protein
MHVGSECLVVSSTMLVLHLRNSRQKIPAAGRLLAFQRRSTGTFMSRTLCRLSSRKVIVCARQDGSNGCVYAATYSFLAVYGIVLLDFP